jgi:hypothetical protein
MKKIAVLTFAISLLATPGLVSADSFSAAFDPNFVVSNAETEETSLWSADDVNSFLYAKGGGLAGMLFADTDGQIRRAADIIINASKRNSISPRFLLALIQREQSLVTDLFPSQNQLDWATGYGVCDSCSKSDPALAKDRGFATQIESAAASFRFYLDGGNKSSGLRQRNVPTVIDGIPVKPMTDATAALYNYTPHVIAQINFWNIWQKYFVRRYPNGSILTTKELNDYWYIFNGERRKLASPAVLYSRFNPGKVVTVSANDVLAYPIGQEMKFANYSLLQSPKGTVYLIVDDEKRGFASAAIFRKLGFSRSEVDQASFDDLAAYPEGAPITIAAAYPLGALLQVPKTGGVYFVQNGVKRAIYGNEIIGLYFKNLRINIDRINELADFSEGDPIALRDGELVRGQTGATVYVINGGTRQPIKSEKIFTDQGWNWKNVVTVSDKVLSLSPLGSQFNPQANNLEMTND